MSNLRGPSTIEDELLAHIVLDIDWTIVTPLEDNRAKEAFKGLESYIELNDGSAYLLKEGVLEILDAISQSDQYKVSFFSGGKKERNIELLKHIKIKNGKTAFEVADKVLSFDDLSTVSKDQNLRFSERLKKDLMKSGSPLEKTILIEDIPHFAKGARAREQTIWIGDTYFPALRDWSIQDYRNFWEGLGKQEKFLASSKDNLWWSQRKFYLLTALIEQSLSAQEIISQAIAAGVPNRSPDQQSIYIIKSGSYYRNYLRTYPCELPL